MKRIIVENHEKKRLIVQPSMIPAGYKTIGEYEPKKTGDSHDRTGTASKSKNPDADQNE